MRPIKPEIWQSQDFLSLSILGRLLFIGLITMADDDGRLKASPDHVMALFGLNDRKKSTAEVTDQLRLMGQQGMVRTYRVEGQGYLCLPNWNKHQKPAHYKASDYPDPSTSDEQPVLPFPTDSRALTSAHERVSSRADRDRDGDRDVDRDRDRDRDREDAVFTSWLDSLPPGSRMSFTRERRSKVRDRLRSRKEDGTARFTVEDLQLAAGAWKKDPWTGRTEQNDLKILMRDDSQVEKFINLAVQPRAASGQSKVPEGNALAYGAWVNAGRPKTGEAVELDDGSYAWRDKAS